MLDYLKVFPDIEVLLKRYDDAQRGRLFMAMMAYAYRGELPTFGENAPEWYVWDTLQFKIEPGGAGKVLCVKSMKRIVEGKP